MERYYKIADRYIRFSIPYEIKDSRIFENFRIEKPQDIQDILHYKIIKGTPSLKSWTSSLMVRDDIKLCNFQGESRWYFFSHNEEGNEYGCLVEKDGLQLRKLYIYFNFFRYLSDTEEIFRRGNIQGVFLKEHIVILHSSFILHRGEGILFTGMSGVGKSTQASLWEKYGGAEIVNGDRTAIALKDNRYYGFGVPFCGSSNVNKNKEAPIKAIVALEQKEYNSVKQLSVNDGFKILLSQIAINRWSDKDMDLAMNVIENIISKVPILKLSCKPDEDATKVLKKYLYSDEGSFCECLQNH